MSKTLNGKTTYVLCDIVMIPKRLNYNKQAKIIADYMAKPHFKTWKTKLVIDASGVGGPVCDNLVETHDLKFDRAIITSGDGRKWNNVSRNWLIRNLVKWLSKPRFYISTDVDGADDLRAEINALRPEYRKDGTITYVSREHDDMVMALALGLMQLQKNDAVRSGVTDYFFSTVHGTEARLH